MTYLFDHLNYKEYLSDRLNDKAPGNLVNRSRLAKAIGCQPSYVSRVINEDAHLSLEQAHAANIYLQHSEEESHYFLLLVEWARAGTPALKSHLEKFAKLQREQILNLKKRLKIEPHLSGEDQITYYSSWHYAAIHTSIGIPGYETIEKVADRFQISRQRVSEVVDFLVQVGLISIKNSKYVAGIARLHLGNDSDLISRHHLNWRMQAVRSLEHIKTDDLHYSSVVSISEKDLLRIKSELVKAIERAKGIVKDSDEEVVCCFSVDLFRI